MPEKAQLQLPNGKIISARRMAKKWPDFAAEMDGSSEECTLSWYYKLEGDTFVLKGPDEEDEISEILNVNVTITNILDNLDDSAGSTNAMTEDQIREFKAQLAEIRSDLESHYAKK